ncbi:MAG: HD domain-containing protein [Desulfobacterales bacterium]|nr:HD domain-containing protein [Desulfobacterales bacterium]
MNKQFNKQILEIIKSGLNDRESGILSTFATLSIRGLRRLHEEKVESGHRQNFAIDADRILHSLAYSRYIDKTQVFSLIQNDHITHRVLHVQLASKIARTIGRFLGLNEDLIEAIAIGHDIGHTPFGHDGEKILSEICVSMGIGRFCHNVQSVNFLDKIEGKGEGLNLCVQTLDGILCHNGEIHEEILAPDKDKSFESIEKDMVNIKNDPTMKIVPMTLEGCVVRFADTISYIGRDIEDAIRLNLIKRSDIPKISTDVFGNTNGTIVYSLVTDVIINSVQKPYISFSSEVGKSLKILKDFNYEQIYLNPKIKSHIASIKKIFSFLFEKYINDIKDNNKSSVIFKNFLDSMSETYREKYKESEIVRDFISSMTDQYFLRQAPESLRPKPVSFS